MPLVRQVRRRLGRRVSVIGAMFPRYLFVRLDSDTDNWAPIRSTLGVVSIVRFGHEPARVPDRFVDYLRSREDEKGIQTVAVDELKPGMRVLDVCGGTADLALRAARTMGECGSVVVYDINWAMMAAGFTEALHNGKERSGSRGRDAYAVRS